MAMACRIIKVALLSVLPLVGVVVLVIAGRVVYLSIDKEDSFVLENAELSEVGYLRRVDAAPKPKRVRPEDEQFGVYAHRLKRGSGTVFAWRFYSNGEFWTMDDEVYRKITLWVAAPAPTSPTNIALGDESKAVLISCLGGSAWPGSECCGYATSGTVTITPLSGRYRIAIEADVATANRRTSRCGTERVDRRFTAKKIAFEDVTPWLGIAGRSGHPYDETYRR
jgi:hypothetical protein